MFTAFRRARADGGTWLAVDVVAALLWGEPAPSMSSPASRLPKSSAAPSSGSAGSADVEPWPLVGAVMLVVVSAVAVVFVVYEVVGEVRRRRRLRRAREREAGREAGRSGRCARVL